MTVRPFAVRLLILALPETSNVAVSILEEFIILSVLRVSIVIVEAVILEVIRLLNKPTSKFANCPCIILVLIYLD